MKGLASIELTSGVKIQLRVINPRLLTITPSSALYEVFDKEGKLKCLDFDGEYTIERNQTVMVGVDKYKITEIIKSPDNDSRYELYTFKKVTNTANFVMPFLGGNRLSFRWGMEFTNAFISLEGCDHDGMIHLLYRFNGDRAYADFEESLKLREDFVSADDTDKYHVLYTFKLPKESAEDVELIMNGKYSRVSEKHKAKILEFHGSSKLKPTGQILYRCEKRRLSIESKINGNIGPEGELLDMFDLSKEEFKKEFIID